MTQNLLILNLMFMPLFVKADAAQCLSLFEEKTFKVNEFNIVLTDKKKSDAYLSIAYESMNIEKDAAQLNDVLTTIAESGLEGLTADQKDFIIVFRQNTSYLRSVFQTSSYKHKSPKEFARFVRDFGHLKDMLLIHESLRAKKMAIRILSKYPTLDFENLLEDVKPATRKSTKKYFKAIIKNTQNILRQPYLTVDELHDVRKALRDVLRYMQIQNELSTVVTGANHTKPQLSQEDSVNDSAQVAFLKKTNRQLGKICDDNAALIIQGQLTEDAIIEFPVKLKNKVLHFLESYRFVEE